MKQKRRKVKCTCGRMLIRDKNRFCYGCRRYQCLRCAHACLRQRGVSV